MQEKMVSDYVTNNPTVASLANEDIIIKRYFAEGEDSPQSSTLKKQNIYEAIVPAAFYGAGFSFYLVGIFFTLLVAAHNVKAGHDFEDQVMCMTVFIYSFLSVSFLMSNLPDFGRSLQAAEKIMVIQDYAREGHKDSPIVDGELEEEAEDIIKNGDIQFHNVWFRYPNTDEDMWVLENFKLTIQNGQSVGLVGESG